MNLKSKIIALIALAVISMSVLFHSNSTKVHALASVQHANVLKKLAQDTAQMYKAKIDSLSQTNIELEQEVSDNAQALHHAKQVNQVLQQKVTILTTSVETETDTPTKLADCDSLAGAITELSISNNNKDSLYEQIQTGLKSEVGNRDSVITVQQHSNTALQNSFYHSLASQDTLQNNCKLLQKQLNHQVFKKKFLSGALLTLSGITLYSLLRH